MPPSSVVDLDPPNEDARALWRSALDLMGEFEGDWSLIGGLMVQLHASRFGQPATRSTEDIDILGDSRKRPSVTERIGQTLRDLGIEIAERLVDPPVAFRFERDGTVVGLLAPDGTASRNPPKTVDNHQTRPSRFRAVAKRSPAPKSYGSDWMATKPTFGAHASWGPSCSRRAPSARSTATRTARISPCCWPASRTPLHSPVSSRAGNGAGCAMPATVCGCPSPTSATASRTSSSPVPAPPTGCSRGSGGRRVPLRSEG